MKKTYKLTLPKDKEVANQSVRIEDGNIVVDVEFNNEFEPKDGDFLVSTNGNVFIYSDSTTASDVLLYSCYCGVRVDGKIMQQFSDSWTLKLGCRFATPEEKTAFLERLEKEYNKRWNPEKKCLEDIFNPKDGDFLVTRGKVFIYSDRKSVFGLDCCCYCGELENGKMRPYFNYSWANKSECRYATQDEIKDFLNKLEKECHTRWNPETKQLEETRWEPDMNGTYWFIDETMNVCSTKQTEYVDIRVGRCNCFRTEEAAQKVADQIKQILKESSAE